MNTTPWNMWKNDIHFSFFTLHNRFVSTMNHISSRETLSLCTPNKTLQQVGILDEGHRTYKTFLRSLNHTLRIRGKGEVRLGTQQIVQDTSRPPPWATVETFVSWVPPSRARDERSRLCFRPECLTWSYGQSCTLNKEFRASGPRWRSCRRGSGFRIGRYGDRRSCRRSLGVDGTRRTLQILKTWTEVWDRDLGKRLYVVGFASYWRIHIK